MAPLLFLQQWECAVSVPPGAIATSHGRLLSTQTMAQYPYMATRLESTILVLVVFWVLFCFTLFFEDFLNLFLERGEKREKEGEKHPCAKGTYVSCLSQVPSQGPGPPPGHVPWLGIYWRPFGSQAGAQSTEPHQPGHRSSSSSGRFVCIYFVRHQNLHMC